MATETRVLSQGQKAYRVYVALKDARGFEDVAEVSSATGLHVNTIRSVVRTHGEKIARKLGGARLVWHPASYGASGSGPFGHYGNARGFYQPAAIEVV